VFLLFLPSGALITQPSADCLWRSRLTNSSYSLQEGPGPGEYPRPHPFLEAIMHMGVGRTHMARLHGVPTRNTQITPSNRYRLGFVQGRSGFVRGLTTTSRGARQPQRVIRTPNGRVILLAEPH